MKHHFVTLVSLTCLGVSACGAEPADEDLDVLTRAYTEGAQCSEEPLKETKAALAVAMATEIGSLDALSLLDIDEATGTVVLNQTALAACLERGHAECPNTRMLLNLQNPAINEVVEQNAFNATAYRQDLLASVQRQRDWLRNLELNDPDALPEEHVLIPAGVSDLGACGPHYLFDALSADQLGSLADADDLRHHLAFFGYPDNEYLAFRTWGSRIGIDPTAELNPIGPGLTCRVACYAYDGNLRKAGKCCICQGEVGIFQPAAYDPYTVLCRIY